MLMYSDCSSEYMCFYYAYASFWWAGQSSQSFQSFDVEVFDVEGWDLEKCSAGFRDPLPKWFSVQ